MIESRVPQLKHVRILLDTMIMPLEYRTTCMRLEKLHDEGLDICTRRMEKQVSGLQVFLFS
jgi:hypothetical protein